MKKLILFTCIIAGSMSVYSQKGKLKLSIVAGGNAAFPVGPEVRQFKSDLNKAKSDISSSGGTISGSEDPRYGFHCGVTVSYFLANKFAVTSGLVYSQRGSRIKLESSTPQITYYQDPHSWGSLEYKWDEKSSFNAKYNYDYIDIPINAKLFLSKAFYFNGGFVVCALVSDSYTNKREKTELDQYTSPPTTKINTDGSNTGTANGKSSLIGFNAGFGITGEKFGIAFGISKTGNPSPQFTGIPSNLTVQAGLTYSFDLLKK